MKLRMGFVTNSSSSAFIVVIGKVTPESWATVEENELQGYMISGAELKNSAWSGDLGAEWAGVYIPLPKDLDPQAQYIYLRELQGDEEDFWNEGSEEYNHDVDLSFFDKEYQKVFNVVTKENGFEQVDKGYGAGRNG